MYFNLKLRLKWILNLDQTKKAMQKFSDWRDMFDEDGYPLCDSTDSNTSSDDDK